MADAPRPEFKSWHEMLDWMSGLLLRRTGHDVPWWLGAVRNAGLPTEAATRTWLTENGVAGYAQNPVMWELFGFPDFFLKDAAELLEGQYADRLQLRPIADAVIALVLAWAEDGTGQATVQLRKTYISLLTPRRKFAQVTPVSKSAVDIFLRLDEPAGGLLEAAAARPDNAFRLKIRLRQASEVGAEVADILLRAYRANT
ncbi:hypothetical protein QO003_002306 [Arthrobacter silviterrae]|uniref:DUF5655 domain-containing protein n=1 Tax=Arthrobacter silviterrae TaxID=2026658 RepID=A0ABX0D9J0_9MICC|nr:hypothetical protein [Arthrobacter silviterrae]MDQ0278003.1 hypothetical protein [Arthrobacter silviterrae]NGN83557.1 hypothetical protein [Arthrobacter silviterrae]